MLDTTADGGRDMGIMGNLHIQTTGAFANTYLLINVLQQSAYINIISFQPRALRHLDNPPQPLKDPCDALCFIFPWLTTICTFFNLPGPHNGCNPWGCFLLLAQTITIVSSCTMHSALHLGVGYIVYTVSVVYSENENVYIDMLTNKCVAMVTYDVCT